MIYVGVVVDRIYWDDKAILWSTMARLLNNRSIHSRNVDDDYQKTCRVYSDEMPMASGMIAYAQMQRCFKMKHPSKWMAWQAWRALV